MFERQASAAELAAFGLRPEDYAHENGCYFNTCYRCQRSFAGHKRRVSCKTCHGGA